MNPLNLIKYIVWYATQQGAKLTTNRLVKFLYLADLYHARVKQGETITGFPWRFIYYGPYCTEAGDAINKAAIKNIICRATYDSYFGEDEEYNIFSCDEDEAENFGDQLHIGVIGHLQKAIKQYGDDTPQLLDYIYFETEPMQDVRMGDILDFSKVKKPDLFEKIQLKKLSPSTIKQARAKIKKLSDDLKSDRERLITTEIEIEKYRDENYYKFLKLLDGDELEIGLTGTAKIQISE